jgi:hypothetical protein
VTGVLLSTLAFAAVYYGLSALFPGRLGFPEEPDARLRGTAIATAVFLALSLGLQAAGALG